MQAIQDLGDDAGLAFFSIMMLGLSVWVFLAKRKIVGVLTNFCPRINLQPFEI
jgi:hypothetical protein